ncbi:MAG: DUF5946 family protein [Gammaproteobacteria bacterium]|nr:DUF5946 family protein [Gammaproteobacteria bacterium]MDD9959515.1 DUF5946 family protein [Gammaproteobacteria bacterium]
MGAQSAGLACGAVATESEGPIKLYLGSAPDCWAAFGQVLEKDFADYSYAKNDKLSGDACALQHPDSPPPQTISSTTVHLALFARWANET